ncbi:MAG: PTS system mannose-specific IIA component [Gammaproteobacteria bacterium]|jgi:PTS system mannose-specific IIA component
MSVGLLLVSHDGIASSLLDTAMQMITDCTLNIELLTVERDSDPDEMLKHAHHLVNKLDTGDGVLILSDLFGSTPCNIAMACTTNAKVNAIAGLNLSMLVRVMNYPELDLSDLTVKAISGGQEGILQIRQKEEHAN